MLSPALRDELAAIVGRANVHDGPAQLIAYSYDGTFQQQLPDGAVSPTTTDQVAAILRLASREGLPVVPRGGASSLAGGTIPETGGIVLNLARMNRILEIDRANSCAVVEAGVVTARLQAAAEAAGLFYPPDPSSLNQSTLGGNVACNAGGPRCLKYGVTKDYVLGMTVVLADGRILRLGGKLLKNVTGYQLAQLFIGSEGTLGVITELVLRLIPLPRHRATAVAVFRSLDEAGVAVTAVMQAGVLPVALELMDNLCINLVEDYLHAGLPRQAEALLLLEQDGHDPTAVRGEVEVMAGICRAHGAVAVRLAQDEQQRAELWAVRRAVSPALGRAAGNKLGEDIAVPRSQIPAMVRRIQEIGRQFGLTVPVFGHAGDGNLHPNILFDRTRPGELERVEQAAAAIFRAALELGGTLSGEHGIGTLKREFLVEDLGPEVVAVMRAIKQVLDPKGILNPGKVFPLRAGEGEQAQPGFLLTLPALAGLGPE